MREAGKGQVQKGGLEDPTYHGDTVDGHNVVDSRFEVGNMDWRTFLDL